MIKFISAFPGVGKSTVFWKASKNNFYAVRNNGTAMFRTPYISGQTYLYDSDSSTFDKNEFPQNYIGHMKEVIHRHAGESDAVMLASSHDNVRKAMSEAGIAYTLIYPDRSLKEEYIQRYKQRNSPESFVNLMESNWDTFIDSCETDTEAQEHIVLKSTQYLIDVI